MYIRGGMATFLSNGLVEDFSTRPMHFEEPGGSILNLVFTIPYAADRTNAKHIAITAEIGQTVRAYKDFDRSLTWEIVESQGNWDLWHLTTDDAKSVVALKKFLHEIIVHGWEVKHAGDRIWHPTLMTDASLEWLKSTGKELGTFIERDARNQRLILWGLPGNKIACNEMIVRHIESMIESGEAIKELESPESAGPVGCVVCMCEAQESITTNCGHSYCQGCFESMCTTAAAIPVHCASGECDQVFLLKELESRLSSSVFTRLLEKAFDKFVSANLDTLACCPIIDCTGVFERDRNGIVICSVCYSAVCQTCNVRNHEGRTCATTLAALEESNRNFQAWKVENNIRDCPGCKTEVEKIDGCNHMTCAACRCHFCWVCSADFQKAAEVYEHMKAEHNGIYDPGEYDGWEDPAEFEEDGEDDNAAIVDGHHRQLEVETFEVDLLDLEDDEIEDDMEEEMDSQDGEDENALMAEDHHIRHRVETFEVHLLDLQDDETEDSEEEGEEQEEMNGQDGEDDNAATVEGYPRQPRVQAFEVHLLDLQDDELEGGYGRRRDG